MKADGVGPVSLTNVIETSNLEAVDSLGAKKACKYLLRLSQIGRLNYLGLEGSQRTIISSIGIASDRRSATITWYCGVDGD